MRKRLLIVTGPQGSGNHVFSRLFSLHPEVAGWEELLDHYWVPSDQEPFAPYWVQPELLQPAMFESHRYHMANVSCPFFYDGVRHVPKIVEVAQRVQSFGVEVVVALMPPAFLPQSWLFQSLHQASFDDQHQQYVFPLS